MEVAKVNVAVAVILTIEICVGITWGSDLPWPDCQDERGKLILLRNKFGMATY